MSPVVAKHTASPRIPIWVMLLVGALVVGASGYAWATHLQGRGEVVAARVTLDGQDLGGTPLTEVPVLVAAHADEVLGRTITLGIGDEELDVALRDLGFDYSVEGTVKEVADARRTGGFILQFASWATIPISESPAQVIWGFDSERAARYLEGLDDLTPAEAVEPSIQADARNELTFTPGRPGSTADLEALVADLSEIDLLDPAPEIRVQLIPVPPTVSDDAAAEVTRQMTELTQYGIRVSVKGYGARLSPERLRSHLVFAIGSGEIATTMDTDGLQQSLEAYFPDSILPLTKPMLDVVDGRVQLIEAGRPPQVCCSRDSAARIADLVLAGNVVPYRSTELDVRDDDDPTMQAWADGTAVEEQVSSFTTNHVCCQGRVENIHRIADVVAGIYLLPGETVSLNEHVGRRTRENGFVAAGAIRQGHLIDEVGGGVSQFATTIFNAAYFAGLDIPEYQSHSIYFSRYPYGREATISWPWPDLVLSNTTGYPILISTSYTDTSITVSMYSTQNVEVEELEQRVGRYGACTTVETDRQRTFADGRVVVDTFYARYRPAEGVDCAGRPIPEPLV